MKPAPVEIGFSRWRFGRHDTRLGALSGLTINGQAAGTGERGVIGGGTLATAHFAVRDSLGPEAQARLRMRWLVIWSHDLRIRPSTRP